MTRVLRALTARLSLWTSSSAYCSVPPALMLPVKAPEQATSKVRSAGMPVRWTAASGERWHQLTGPSVGGSYVPTLPAPTEGGRRARGRAGGGRRAAGHR